MKNKRLKGRLFPLILALAAALSLAGCSGSEAKTFYEEGCAALLDGDSESALSAFEQTIGTGVFLSEAYRGMGITYLGTANYADASIAFEKSLLYLDGESKDYQRDVNLYLAYSRERQGQTDKALAIYDSLIKEDPDADTLFLRGRLHLKEGRSKAAKTDFEQAISLNSDYDLYINIYKVYEEEDKTGDGSYYLEEALTAAKRNAGDYYEQGLVNYYLQDYEEARDLLIQAVKASGNSGKAVFLLGKIYLAMNDIADARAIFREHIEIKETAASAYNGLVLCDLASEDYDSALSHVQDGLAIGDPEAEQALLFNEIVVYEKQAQWSKARQKAVAYVAKYPTDEAGAKEYEFLATR